ncbi:hypothetical protein OA07_24715 [Aphanizomenon flos-aquae 2012/KM1/D3]|nr:hypothetical protein OA07_24715 [Aphanizomenon flos-aquae 2012/KM1/D3]
MTIPFRDFQEINYPKKRTTEAQSTQRENFCISFGTFFYLEVSYSNFQSYEVHLSPLIACGEGVGGGVLVPGLMTICCKLNLRGSACLQTAECQVNQTHHKNHSSDIFAPKETETTSEL